MNNSKLFNSSFKNADDIVVKTKGTLSFLFCLITILMYLLVWVLIGEINALGYNWFSYQTSTINGYFNLNILYWCIGAFLFSIALFLVLYFIRFVKIDLIPFLVMSNTIGMVTIFSAGVPIPDGSDTFTYIVMARFFIVIACALVAFFATNWIVVKLMVNSSYAHVIFSQYQKEKIESIKIKKEHEEIKSKNKPKDYIEVVEED